MKTHTRHYKKFDEKTRKNFREVRAALLMNGYEDIKDFAVQNGFAPTTVRSVIYRHWGFLFKKPVGKKTKEIIKKLEGLKLPEGYGQ